MKKAMPVIILAVFLSACGLYAKATPLPDCDPSLEQLLPREEDFPPDWHIGRPHKDDQFSGGAIDSCVVSYNVLNGVANQIIYEYSDEDEAIYGFSRLLKAFAWNISKVIPVPSFTSNIADEYYFECAVPRDTHICEVVARYGKLTVVFTTHVNPTFMNYDDLEKLLLTIDQLMSFQVIQ